MNKASQLPFLEPLIVNLYIYIRHSRLPSHLSPPHSRLFPFSLAQQTEAHLTRMHGFMSYGHWDFCDGVPVPLYLEPAVHSRRVHFFREQGEDLFRVQHLAAPPCYHHRDQMKKMRSGEKLQGKKQGRVCYVSSTRKPKAVDEDLYKMPPELLYQLPKKKRVLGNFLYGCLGLNCIG